MFSDSYNPIFVLKTQKAVTFICRYRFAILVCVLVPIVLGLALYPSIINTVGVVDEFSAAIFAAVLSTFINFVAFIMGVIPGIVFAKREVDKDLSHFTPMTDKQLIDGYLLSGTFYSCLFLTVLGLPFWLAFALLTGNYFDAGVGFVAAICYAIVLNFFVMSFMTGAKTMTQLIVTGLMIYMVYTTFLGLFYLVGMLPHLLFALYQYTHGFSPEEFYPSAYVYWVICIPCVVLVSYRLALYHFRLKETPFSKHCIIIGFYLLLLAALTILSLVLFGLIELLPAWWKGEVTVPW